MSLERGFRLGPYEILGPLGAGGMGEVYRARDSRLGREVAVKVLSRALAGSPDALARFERESRAVAALSHPNIIIIFDCGAHNGLSYAVSELLHGETLADRMQRAPIRWPEAARIAHSVAEGLAAAHAKGIIHRDIKPHNIFLTSPRGVKLLDFGLARVQNDALAPTGQTPTGTLPLGVASHETMPGALIGTVHYMSPEQVRGQPADARSDIFSLGCVLYEMLTARRPFERATAAETMVAILYDEPMPIENFCGEAPRELCDLIRRCMQKAAEDRPAGVHEIAASLAELMRANPESEPQSTYSAGANGPQAETSAQWGESTNTYRPESADRPQSEDARSASFGPDDLKRDFERLREFAREKAPETFRQWSDKITGDDPPEALRGYSPLARKRILWAGIAIALFLVFRFIFRPGFAISISSFAGLLLLAYWIYTWSLDREKDRRRERNATPPPRPGPGTPPPYSQSSESAPYRGDDSFSEEVSDKSLVITALLCIMFGIFGAHRFYVGKMGSGIVQACTIGGLGIWMICDFIIIILGGFTDADDRRIRELF